MKQGEFDNFDVPFGKTTVEGTVRGVRVGPGASLTVTGVLTGPVEVGESGVLVVVGVFNAGDEPIRNDGIIMVGGVTDVTPRERSDMGNFAASPGTVLAHERLLQADGSEEYLKGHRPKVTVDSGTHLVWMDEFNRFVTVEELKRLTPEPGAPES